MPGRERRTRTAACASSRPDRGPANASEAREQELARDDHPLDLGRALADRAELDVAIELLDGEILREAVSAVDLDGEIRDAHGDLRGVELRHRRFLRRRAALVLQPAGAVCQEPRRLDLGGHVAEEILDRLELRDRLAELPPLLRVTERALEGALGHAEGERRDRIRQPVWHGQVGNRDIPYSIGWLGRPME